MFDFDMAAFVPYRDKAECLRVRHIKKADITEHPNPEFRITVIEEPSDFHLAFAMDFVGRLKKAREEGKGLVVILPVGPMSQYRMAAAVINSIGLNCHHLTAFNMDEYADQDGNTAPPSWPGSFQKAMRDNFYNLITEDLRPLEERLHFPTKGNLPYYARLMEDAGGVDVCYGGVGWCGHVAFWEAHLGAEFEGMEDFVKAGPRLVDLHPMTIMQNALHSFGGDWSMVPPKACTIGPAQVVGARDRSFWLDGAIAGGIGWQRFIARLAAHGKPNPYVPATVLQTVPGSYTLLGAVAEDVTVSMC